MKIVVLDAHTLSKEADFWQPLDELADVHLYSNTMPNEVVTRCKEAEIILTNKVVINNQQLNQLPKLKMISILATGYDHVDIEASKKCGIVVCNVQGYSTDSVAQHVFALLLNISNDIGLLTQSVADGYWQQSLHFCYWRQPLFELVGKTIGVVGLGEIGRKVCQIALALGMNVLAYSRTPKNIDGLKNVDLKTLLTSSDIVSLHCPLSHETQGLINKETLRYMKKDAILINTGRGGLIDEAALAQALREKQILAACLDVLSKEPPDNNNPLIGLKNCYITPHVAWATVEARNRLLELTINNIKAFQQAKPINQLG